MEHGAQDSNQKTSWDGDGQKRWELTFVNQDQAQVVPGGESFIDFSKCWSEVEAAQEQPDRDSLA